MNLHDECWYSEPCVAGPQHAETCPKEKIRKRRETEQKGQWSALELRKESGGLRHYLDGKPVHCGMVLEFQETTNKEDDYGLYSVPLQSGVRVRYEASQFAGALTWTLHKYFAGVEIRSFGTKGLHALPLAERQSGSDDPRTASASLWSAIEKGGSGDGTELTLTECATLIRLRTKANNLARLVEQVALVPVDRYYGGDNKAPFKLLQAEIKDIDALIQRKP